MKITDFTLQNKYTTWYNNIITIAKNRASTRKEAKTILEKVEAHHVIPRSIWKDTANTFVVYLSTKEHFVVHHLLIHMTCGTNKHKMISALSQFKQGRSLTARQASICMKYKHQPCSDTRKHNISTSRLKTTKITCMYCNTSCDNGNYTKYHGKNCKLNPNIDPNILLDRKEKHRLKVRDSIKNGTHVNPIAKTGVFICPWCLKSGTNWGVMQRWHYDKCKVRSE